MSKTETSTWSMSHYDLPYDAVKIVDGPPVNEFPQIGAGLAVFEKMQENKKLVAQLDGISGKKDTYEALLRRCVRTAIAMRSRGVTPEDIVSVCSYNHLNSFVPFVAALFLGCKPTNLDPNLTATEMTYLVKLVEPKIMFVGVETVDKIVDIVQEMELDTTIVVFGDTVHHLKFSDFILPSPEERDFKPVEISDIKETAVIFFTNGTTGLPKGVCISHYTLVGQAYQTTDFYGDMQHIILVYSSLFWCAASITLLSSIMSGNCFALYPQFDATRVWDDVDKCKVTIMVLSSVRVFDILKSAPPDEQDVSSLRLIHITGQSLHKRLIEQVERMVPATYVMNAYGLTEVGGPALAFRPARERFHHQLLHWNPAASGTIMPGFSYKIINIRDGSLQLRHSKGELRLKTVFQMNGYYKMDSSHCWDTDGWLRTGDYTFFDRDLCYYVTERVNELFYYDLLLTTPGYTEDIIITHPLVNSVAVIGVPHETDRNHPLAVVEFVKNAPSTAAQEILDFVNKQVTDNYQMRGGVKIIDVMPVTPSGKVKRTQVAKMVLDGTI